MIWSFIPGDTLDLGGSNADAPRRVRSYRQTSNSRGPGQKGAVYFEAVPTRLCEDCSTPERPVRIRADIPHGRHAPHHRASDRVLINCAGEVLDG